MEYKVRQRYTINIDESDLKEIYPHDLQFYETPPTGEIPFVEFQQLGLDRLKALQLVESIAARTDLKTVDKRKEALSIALKKDGLKYFESLLHGHGCSSHTDAEIQSRRKDRISHFVLRLVYCQDPDRKKWFVNQEVELFKLRFSSLTKEGVQQLLNANDFGCIRVTQEEKEGLRDGLNSSTAKVTQIDTVDFYKVPFLKVLDLVRGRKVFVKGGMAFISQLNLVSVFVTYFKQSIVMGLEAAKDYLSNISDDERLNDFFKSLPASFSGMTRVVWSNTTTPIEKLDELSKTSYPLCMRNLHEALKTNHHLKNSGRIQYGLFIKGIGVTLEDALKFWREEFTKKVDVDKFDKAYSYSIRHMFGKEGKQTNYTPLGCQKIIMSSVGPGEYHGCPYRHMDRDALRQKLIGYGLPSPSINDILDLSKDGHYQLACNKYFETVHNCPPERPFMHPNSYFAESRAILAKDTDAESTDKMSQNGKIDSVSGAPSQRIGTPSRNTAGTPRAIATPRLNTTPSRTVTPSRGTSQTIGTPARKILKTAPINLEMLNDDDFATLMDES